MLRRCTAAALLVVCLTGCGSDTPPDGGTPSEITGVVTDVRSEGLDEVTSFELRSEGETYEIFIDPEIEYGFRLGHLQAHLVGAEPVIVKLDDRDGKLFATEILDA